MSVLRENYRVSRLDCELASVWVAIRSVVS